MTSNAENFSIWWRHYDKHCPAAGPSETETEMSSGWQLWSSLETFKTSFNVHSDHQGCHPDDLFVRFLKVTVITLRSRQSGQHFCKRHFQILYEVFCILIPISLKFVPISLMNSNLAMVQIMVWCQKGIPSRYLYSAVVVSVYWRIYTRSRSGGWFNIKMPSYQYRKSHVEIRRSYNRLISTMGIPILVRWHLYVESGPSHQVPPQYRFGNVKSQCLTHGRTYSHTMVNHS